LKTDAKTLQQYREQQDDIFGEQEFYWFLEDPIFMQKALFNRDLHVAQRLQSRLMWFCPSYVDSSGYRFGKSANATYVQMCQCLLIPGWQEGILSHTLRGAQYLFRDHIFKEYDTNPTFRALCKRRPTRGNEWRVEFTNNSSITAFPSDITNDSQRLESLSLHGATIDEATAYPKPEVIWDVMLNRVTMPVPPLAQKLGITNTVRVIGAAKFTYQAIYKQQQERGGLIEMTIRRMKEWADGDKSAPMEDVFMTFTLDEHLPPDEVCWACGGINDTLGRDDSGKLQVQCRQCGYRRVAWQDYFKATLRTMKNAKQLMSNRLYLMRWNGKWQDSSDDVYSPNAIRSAPRPDVRLELHRPEDDISQRSLYGIGVDIGTGATERHSVSGITVVKHSPPDPHYRVVYSARHSCSLRHLSGYIYRAWEAFAPNVITVDPGGGGSWLIDGDHLAGSEQTIVQGGTKTVQKDTTPLVQFDEQMAEKGVRVISLFSPACLLLKESIGTMIASDQMINWAHDLLSGLIDNSMVICPMSYRTADGKWLKRAERVFNAIHEALQGLTRIGIALDIQGNPDLTKNGFFQFTPKPDLAYSLVYALAGLYLFINSNKERLTQEGSGISVKAVPLVGSTAERKQKKTVTIIGDQSGGIAVRGQSERSRHSRRSRRRTA
jgi:hypothetical protein